MRWLGYLIVVAIVIGGALWYQASAEERPYAGMFLVEINAPDSTVGSGVYIGEGYILTANHVVMDDNDKQHDVVKILTTRGATRDATVMMSNSDLDIALLKVTEEINLGVAELDCRRVKEPEAITAYGVPHGLDFVAESGFLSPTIFKDVPITGSHKFWKFVSFISADVAGGMSGGPIISEDGKILGIIVARLGDNDFGDGLAVPSIKICELFPDQI